MLPAQKRPQIVYSGNQALAKRFKEAFEGITPIRVTPNIRPSIDVEDLTAAQETVASIIADVRAEQVGGLGAASTLCSAPVKPTSFVFSRAIRFLSKIYDTSRGVMGIDLGGSQVTLAAASGGSLVTNVLGPMGMGTGLTGLLQQSRMDEITQWLAYDIPEGVVKDYLWQKSAFPASLPVDRESLAIEQAAARRILNLAIQQTRSRWPDMGSEFEPVFLGGAILSQAPVPWQAFLMALDGLQPGGVTTFVQDPFGLLPCPGGDCRNQFDPAHPGDRIGRIYQFGNRNLPGQQRQARRRYSQGPPGL